MHMCFKKLINDNTECRRIWATEMLLFRADDGALSWMNEVNVGEDVIRLWIFTLNKPWVDAMGERAPLIKFIGMWSRLLDQQPFQHLLRRQNNIQRLLLHVFESEGLSEAESECDSVD